jgi:hypothetical protein
MDYKYWTVEYITCEGRNSHAIARSPDDWTIDMVKCAIPLGGIGDDVAEVISVEETNGDDYYWNL